MSKKQNRPDRKNPVAKRAAAAFSELNARMDGLAYALAYAMLQRQMRAHWSV